MGNREMNIGDILTREWDRSLKETPYGDPWESVWRREMDPHYKPPTYRERLDRPKRNYYGEVIPRRVIIERNIRHLGKPPKPPNLP